MLDIYVDADGCPVKEEVYRVAKRHGLKAYVVANSGLRIPPGDQVEMVVVKGDFNAADDWIAEHAGRGDIVITADIPLADRALQKGARVIGPTGRPFTDKSIGNALATRELMDGLRKMGEITGGPSAFSPKDRSSFLSRLDETIHAIRKAAK